MIAAMLAGGAAWFLVSDPPRQRIRWLLGARTSAPRVQLPLAAAALAPALGLIVLGPVLGVLIGTAAAPLLYRTVAQLESAPDRRRAAELAASLPTALDLMVSALEVGRPPVDAFSVVAEATPPPLGPELAAVAARLELAADPALVWQLLSEHPVLGGIGRAFARAHSSGMPIAAVVAGTAVDARRSRAAERRQHGRKIAVQTAAPLGACFLPAFFLVGIVPMLVASFSSLLP